MTQAQLAQELGVSQRAVAAYELGERRPSTEVAKRLMRIFELDVNEIWEMFYGTERDHPKSCVNLQSSVE